MFAIMARKKGSGSKRSAETPLMKQYNAIKQKHPGTVLLFRVGDFYETFGADAVKVAGILDIVLTKRANGSASHVELAGFPHHSLDTYLPRLVRAGERVAVCDQLEDPKQAKGIVKRGVTELVTPGVALNDKILDSREANYLAAVHFPSGKSAGLAVVEVSTGDFFCCSGSHAHIEKLISTLKPSEVLCPRKDLRTLKVLAGEKLYVTRVEDWVFQEDYGREQLLRHFGTNSLKGFGVEAEVEGCISAGAILHYLRENQQTQLGHLNSIYLFDDSGYVWLDAFTIRNLELLHPNHPDGKALVDVLDQTLTPMGARRLRKWLLFPLKDIVAIRERLGLVEAFIKDPEQLRALGALFQQMGDLERLVSKLASHKLLPREAQLLKTSLGLLEPMQACLAEFGAEAVGAKLAAFQDCSGALAVLNHFLHPKGGTNLSQGGVIADAVSEELDELRGLSGNSKELLLNMQQREIETSGISSLKVGFNKVFGYYLEVTNAHKDKVPEHFIRKQTLTNAERYITPELKEYEEKILGAEEKIIALEQQLYAEMIEQLQAHLMAIQANAQLIAELDVFYAFSEVSKAHDYCLPDPHTGEELDIRAGRHPVIEQTLSRAEPYVPNDVFLDTVSQQIIIITGPNMAGKSALLRQTALIVLLCQIGCFVPAEAARVGLVDKIFTRVGASDNISSGESTFMVEMNETAQIINGASRKSLVLLDEIGRGTSTYDGVSIAWALVEYLHQAKACAARTLFATHYHELNEIAKKMERVRNYNVSVKEEGGKIIFLRKLVPGGSNHSFGIQVAKMAGMPKTIVKRAQELLVHFESARMEDQEQAKRVVFTDQSTSLQLNMFELKDMDTLKIREIMKGVDIDRMTPVEALLKLQEIKRALVDPEF